MTEIPLDYERKVPEGPAGFGYLIALSWIAIAWDIVVMSLGLSLLSLFGSVIALMLCPRCISAAIRLRPTHPRRARDLILISTIHLVMLGVLARSLCG